MILVACGGGGGSSGSGTTPVANGSSTSSSSSSSSSSGSSGGAVIAVGNADELVAALAVVNPGETIQLASGTYAGTFVATRSGSADLPITLKGPATAVLQNNATSGKRYGLYLNGVSHWVLDGFTVSNSQKGIVTDQANFNVLQNLTVHDIEDEAVHFRSNSADNIIQHSSIYNTGLVQPQYGEAVYLGSAKSNWGTYTADVNTPDLSHRNKVLNNTIGPNVAAEGVDVKEGTQGGLIQGNVFDCSGISGQNSGDSAIDMKGDHYTVDGNTVTNTPTVTSNNFIDGFQVHVNTVNSISYGFNNIFSNNTINLNTTGPEGAGGYIAIPAGSSQGYGVSVQSSAASTTTVCTSNTILNAISIRGLTNITPTTCP